MTETSLPFGDRTFAAVLFDMDGTLIDSTPAVNRSWLQWGREYGIDPSYRQNSHGRPARQLIESLVSADLVEASVARVTELEVADTADIIVLGGAADLLASIPEACRAIVTSCTRELAAVRIAASGLDAPTTVVTIDDTERGKPAPDPFEEGARRLGVDARDCLVVEDAPAGLAAGRAAGCTTIAVTGTHSGEALEADLVVSSLAQLRIEIVPGDAGTAPRVRLVLLAAHAPD